VDTGIHFGRIARPSTDTYGMKDSRSAWILQGEVSNETLTAPDRNQLRERRDVHPVFCHVSIAIT
jgi:hypothetical protein